MINNQTPPVEVDEFGDIIEPEISRAQLKREMRVIQGITEKICEWSDSKLNEVEFPEELLISLNIAKRLKSSNAKNRQLRHASKIVSKLSEETMSQIKEIMEREQKAAENMHARHHILERWRDGLVNNDSNTLEEIFTEYPSTDRQELRALMRSAMKEKSQGKKNDQQRKLFRYLRDNLQ